MKMQIPGKCKLEAKQKSTAPAKELCLKGGLWPKPANKVYSFASLQPQVPSSLSPWPCLQQNVDIQPGKHGGRGAAPWSSWNWCQLSLSLYISSVCPWEKTEVCCGITKGKQNTLLPSSSSMALQQHTALPRRLPHLQVSQTAPPTGDRVLRQ